MPVAWVALGVLAVSLATAIAVSTPWQPLPGADLEPAPSTTYFTPDQIVRSEAFFDAVKWPSWLRLAVSLGVPLTVAFTPLGCRLVRWVRGWTGRWALQVVALGTAVIMLQRAATLPFDIWTHRVATAYGLSTQTAGEFAIDVAKSAAITELLTCLGLVGVVALARRFPRTWFAPGAVAAGALVVVASFAYPVVLEPIFNRFTPLADGPLRTRLVALAERDHVSVTDVLVADASRRTTTLNAYVSGFGASKRIVVYDTLLGSASDDEIALVVAHELGHAVRDDVLVGTFQGSLAAALGVVTGFLVLRRPAVRRHTGAGSAGDPAVAPVLLALASLAVFAAAPAVNTVSRAVEARADAHALNLTGDPETFIKAQQRLAVANLTHLQPNSLLAFWFASHPAPLDRIGMARAWQRQHEEP